MEPDDPTEEWPVGDDGVPAFAAMEVTIGRLAALGIPWPATEPFEYELFGRVHVATLRLSGGHWVLRSASGEFNLAELRAYSAYGDKRYLSRLEKARWLERLDWEAGGHQPDAFETPLLDDASSAAHAIVSGIGLFLTLRDERWALEEPFVFAREFAKAWCGVTEDGARRGIRELEQLGVIERVGKSGRALLWRLADPELIELIAEYRGRS
jgi:hypothetical protein